MTGGIALSLLIAIPLLGAVSGFAVWSKPQALKTWALLVSLATLALVVALSPYLAGLAIGIPLLALLPITAFASLLAQPPHQTNRQAWIMTLVLLGLGLGVVISHGDRLGLGLLTVILILVAGLIHRYRAMSVYRPWKGIGTCGFGIICLIVVMTAPQPLSAVALLAAFAIFLPLVPLHGGYIAALAGLPGNLPAFLSFLLPALGFQGLLAVQPTLPSMAADALMMLGVTGALYGALKALAQSRVRSLLAYANLSFYSILWWYLGFSQSVHPHAAIYLSAVGLATSGLLIAWYAIQTRYGTIDLRGIRGLAQPMPRFALLFTLLALAALGLPPFGVYAGFMGMVLSPGFSMSGGLIGIGIAWLAASWYLLDLAQRLIFGRHRPDLRYEDLRVAEMTSLLLIVILLTALGVAPSRVFESTTSAPPDRIPTTVLSWNK